MVTATMEIFLISQHDGVRIYNIDLHSSRVGWQGAGHVNGDLLGGGTVIKQAQKE